eukprot:CAMPEP_0183418866 /NCGR_PEP_ID=MMETSP0370-20130417/25391_1 /TAXON_ID=268820 /ORGANISM="Peridinium aciculiferum, Strain PAER-2" /LENGTH=695 /DNA_ID=CAMNT_0025602607 /DNA_START=23 /DNA_END=2111 /DNA_ORIENTATION=+
MGPPLPTVLQRDISSPLAHAGPPDHCAYGDSYTICASRHPARTRIAYKHHDALRVRWVGRPAELGHPGEAEEKLGAYNADLSQYVHQHKEPTIIYACSIGKVTKIHKAMIERLGPKGISVGMYHGEMSMLDRESTHKMFMTNEHRAVVATLAFGMGIDKPDIRCVMHIGPPKSIEEYYQQIGRVGRDGMVSKCLMLFKESDFVKLAGGFWTKGLSEERLETYIMSQNWLRSYCHASAANCRRAMICRFFGEHVTERCGTCDLCTLAKSKAGQERDFTREAKIICSTLKLHRMMLKSQMIDILKGMPEVVAGGKTLKKQTEVLEALLPSLGYMGLVNRKLVYGEAFSHGYELYGLSQQGLFLVEHPDKYKVIFSPPFGLLELEAKAETRLAGIDAEALPESALEGTAKERKKQIAGIDLEAVPKSAPLESKRTGNVTGNISWYSNWLTFLRERGHEDRAHAVENLLESITDWRDKMAVELGVAPHTVLADNLVRQLAVRQPKADVLRGLLMRRLEALVLSEGKPNAIPQSATAKSAQESAVFQVLQYPSGHWTPPHKWEAVEASPGSGEDMPTWERASEAFDAGVHLEAIAAMVVAGKPIPKRSAIGLVLESLRHGRTVDMSRLSEFLPRITSAQWNRFSAAVEALSLGSGFPTSQWNETMKALESEIIDLDEFRITVLLTFWYIGFSPTFAPANE